ncbi:response regulator [Pseudomonas sp. NFACC42-2]|uniref:response regulator n=1 Tax=Pseudomonas sp. NFACC42-2 TaxID=1566193 RepID=UPI0008EF2E3D|nr:response regulator [Pseudomonas sp. NFACC42-2]SFS29053.1 Putative DNA-binding domain-containing protein [Pseudomonas sp. NFACC42-2]
MINILWADDQHDVIASIVRVLGMDDVNFELTSDGEDALCMIQDKVYDLVLIDLAMPPGRWGGLWLLQKINELKLSLPSIVVSGEGSQAETIKALRLGAVDYVTKENLINELPQQLKRALDKKAKQLASLSSIIKGGETDTVEFKSTLRINLRTGLKDREMEFSVLKTLTGFFNASGGTLLVGVNDEGIALGIEKDLFPNADKFQLHFWNIFREAIGTEYSEFIKTEMIEDDEKFIFSVRCLPSNRPVFLKWKATGQSKADELFYLRVGPQTELLGIRQAITYIEDHF